MGAIVSEFGQTLSSRGGQPVPLLDIGPIVDRLERLERIEGLLVEIRDALHRGSPVAGVVIPPASLPADSDPDR